MLSRFCIVLLAAICILGSAALHGADPPIHVAVVMDGATHDDREPLRAYLTKAMGRPVNVEAPDSYRDTVNHLADSSYDFACLGALVYIRAHAKYGVVPLVQRTSDLQYHSVFITASASAIHSLSDLKGKQFAFGDIDSTSAHLMPYRELKRAGINPETDLKFRYSGSHPATAAMVETGIVDAGAVDEVVFHFLIDGGKLDGKKVRVFHISEPYIDYVWVARKDVSKDKQQQFARALLDLKEGKDHAILKILRARHFVIANDEEYQVTRQIAHQQGMF